MRGIIAINWMLFQIPLLIVLLALPLSWRKLKKLPLEPNSAKWAWFAAGAVVLALLAVIFLGHGDDCFR